MWKNNGRKTINFMLKYGTALILRWKIKYIHTFFAWLC